MSVNNMTATKKLRVVALNEDAIWRVELDSPKGNVIDGIMTAELTQVFLAAAQEPRLKAVVLTGEGDHFSFGASVEEHRPEKVAKMLADFHGLFRVIAASGVPVIAAVRGSCLGGGLELVAFCQRVIAHPEARFGQPEVGLGVFAPVASAILAERIGRGSADDMLITGRIVGCKEAREMRLVDNVRKRPESAALTWVEKHLMTHSASAVRFATRAARVEFMHRFNTTIAELERVYLDELMSTNDAVEGISAFLEKRKPEWSNS